MGISANASIQTDYFGVGQFPPPGARWRSSSGSHAEQVDTACGDMRTLTLGVFEIEVTAATAAEDWSILYDNSISIPFTTTAAVNSTASAINTALLKVFGTGKALESTVLATDGVTVDAATVTIQFADGLTHTLELVPPGGAASTFDAAYTTAGTPSAPVDHKPGLWVCVDPTGFDPTVIRVKEPSSASDRPYGIAVLEGAISADRPILGPDVDQSPIWPAGEPMSVARRMQIVGLAAGEILAADVGAPVYCVVTGARAGYCAKASGAVSEQWTGTIVPNNGDAVGVTIDSFPRVEVVSTASASATAILLRNAINARADLFAVAVATSSGNDVIITFRDTTEHSVVAYTPATADVTPLTATTPPTAATAIATKSTFLTPAADGDRVAVNLFEG
jgi:hypothetical protein